MGANAKVQILVSLRDAASKTLLESLGLLTKEAGNISLSAAKSGSALEAMASKGASSVSAYAQKMGGVNAHVDAVTVRAAKAGSALEAMTSKGASGASAYAQKMGGLNAQVGAVTVNAAKAGSALEAMTSKGASSASAYTQKMSGLNTEVGVVAASAAKAGSAVGDLVRKSVSSDGAFNGMAQSTAKVGVNIQHADAGLSQMERLAVRAQMAVSMIGSKLPGQFDKALVRAKELSSTLGRGMAASGRGAVVLGGAALGAKSVLMPQVGYDRMLGQMANTGFADRDVAGRKAGKEWLKALIDESVKKENGGGLRESAAVDAKVMVDSGVFSKNLDDLKTILPEIQKVKSGVGGDAGDLGQLAVAARQVGGIEAKDMHAYFGKVVAAGGMGQFDTPDMAKWMPQLYAQGAPIMHGMKGTEAMLAGLQVVRMTSGTSDAAGTNYQQYLKDITAVVTQKHAKKSFGLDVQKEMLHNMAGGKMDANEAFVAIGEKILSKSAQYQDLKKQAAAATNDTDKQRVFDDMAGVVKNTEIGKLLANTEAMKAFVAMSANLGRYKEIKGGLGKENGTAGDTAYGTVKDDAQSAVDVATNAKDQGVDAALQRLTPNINAAADAFARFAAANPEATGGTVIGASALGAGGLAVLGTRMLGGSASGRAAGWGAASGLTKGVGLTALASVVAEPVLTAVAGKDSAVTRYGSAAITGASTGALVGSIFPIVGTAVGAAVGGGLALLVEAFNERKSAAQTPAPVAPPAMSTQAANAEFAQSRPPMSMSMIPQSIMLASQAKAAEPTGQGLIQANAQLQQVNQQIATLNQVANNDKLLAPLGQIQSGIAALNGKNYTMTATIPIYIDGNMVAQRVNTINAVESYRGAR